MGMYKIYNYQKDALLKQTMIDGRTYNPIADKKGSFFISEIEYKHCGVGELLEFVAPEPTPIPK